MNAQKFTQKSLEAIQDAQNLALQHNSMQIEQEHLLAALLEQDNGLIPQLMKRMEIDADSLRREVPGLLHRAPRRRAVRSAERQEGHPSQWRSRVPR